MANSLSAEVWLDERRWDALEKALKARGTDIEQHLQDYLMKLYSETVPFDQWVQIESTITKEELETAQAVEEEKVYAVFHVREHGQDNGQSRIRYLSGISSHSCLLHRQSAG